MVWSQLFLHVDVNCPWKEQFIEIEDPDFANFSEIHVDGVLYHKCEKCTKAFPRFSSLQQHVQQGHIEFMSIFAKFYEIFIEFFIQNFSKYNMFILKVKKWKKCIKV